MVFPFQVAVFMAYKIINGGDPITTYKSWDGPSSFTPPKPSSPNPPPIPPTAKLRERIKTCQAKTSPNLQVSKSPTTSTAHGKLLVWGLVVWIPWKWKGVLLLKGTPFFGIPFTTRPLFPPIYHWWKLPNPQKKGGNFQTPKNLHPWIHKHDDCWKIPESWIGN